MRRFVLFGEELGEEVVVVVRSAGDEIGGSRSVLDDVDASDLEEFSDERTIRDDRRHLEQSSDEEVDVGLTRYERRSSDEEGELFR